MTDMELKTLGNFIATKIEGCKYKNKKFKELLSKLKINSDEHQTQPGDINTDKVKSVNETAFQRAIFNAETSIIKSTNGNTKEAHWLDLELPVTFKPKTPRRKCVDLIGKLDNKPFICELKFMKESKGDPPEYGFFELLTYFYLLSHKVKELDEGNVYHTNIKNRDKFKWANISKNKFMILAANEAYWKCWGRNMQDILNLIKDAKNELKIEICLFKTINVNFEKQKGNNDFYKPEMVPINKIWREVTEES